MQQRPIKYSEVGEAIGGWPGAEVRLSTLSEFFDTGSLEEIRTRLQQTIIPLQNTYYEDQRTPIISESSEHRNEQTPNT